MSIVKNKVDAVIVGMGWTGAIMAKELTDAGLVAPGQRGMGQLQRAVVCGRASPHRP